MIESQRTQLRRWRIPVCKVGRDVGRKGMQDPEIVPLLRTFHRPTFVSWDRDFFDRTLCSDRFCLVHMDVRPLQIADYVRRLLRHHEFKTWSQRRGRVIRVAPSGISVWQARSPRMTRIPWPD